MTSHKIDLIKCKILPQHPSFFYREKGCLDRLFNYYESIRPINFIDLGCAVPVYAYLLHHSIGLASFKGYDLKPLEDRVNYVVDEFNFPNKDRVKNDYDIYNNIVELNTENEVNKLFDEDSFDSFFTKNILHQDVMYLSNYRLFNSTSKVSYIHASHILHSLSLGNLDVILMNISQLVTPDGLILFRVKKTQSMFDYNAYVDLINIHFKTGCFYETHKESIFINKTNLIDVSTE